MLRRMAVSLLGLIIIVAGVAWLLQPKKRELISLFPIEHYDQNLTDWIKSSDPDYAKPLLTEQQQKLRQAELWEHYFGKKSPWHAEKSGVIESKC